MKSYWLVILFSAFSLLLNSDMAIAKNSPAKKSDQKSKKNIEKSTEKKTNNKSDKESVSKQDNQDTANNSSNSEKLNAIIKDSKARLSREMFFHKNDMEAAAPPVPQIPKNLEEMQLQAMDELNRETAGVNPYNNVFAEASIYSEKATVWDRPGFSWLDCRPLDPNSKYQSDDDKNKTLERFNTSGQAACNGRIDFVNKDQKVKIILDQNGEPATLSTEVFNGKEYEEELFYKVRFEKEGKTFDAWVAADQLTRPEMPDFEADPPQEEKQCEEPKGSTNTSSTPDKIKKSVTDLTEKIEDNTALGPMKSERELDHFMCLYEEANIGNKEYMDDYLKKFKDSSKAAAKASGIPYDVIMCTMLAESGLQYKRKDKDEYRGHGQFGSAIIKDLKAAMKDDPYKSIWDDFHKVMPNVNFNNASIRKSSDPSATAAAIAIDYRWIYEDRISRESCRDCSKNLKLNRKDLYLMIIGYNYSPYQINQLADRSPASLRTKGSKPPRETKNYMTMMDRCLSKSQFEQYRVEKKCKRKDCSTSLEFQTRKEKCDQFYPLK